MAYAFLRRSSLRSIKNISIQKNPSCNVRVLLLLNAWCPVDVNSKCVSGNELITINLQWRFTSRSISGIINTECDGKTDEKECNGD